MDSDNGEDYPTDIYLHNPHSTVLTIEYETTSGSGTYTIPANSTVSFSSATGDYVPAGSGVYLRGNDVFWGVSTIDTSGGDSYDYGDGRRTDWGYSLVPAFLLDNEHFMGWAPGSTGGDVDSSGIFVSAVQDNIRLFIDFDNDGVADQTYDLDRLESQYIYDPNDGDLSEASIWATGPYAISYGQNPDTSDGGTPAIDVGYTTLPGANFIDLVLTVEKTTDPLIVPTTAGSQTVYTLVVDTYDFDVDGLDVVDTLPVGWQYVDDSSTITLADHTTISENSADPTITDGGLTLTWDSALLADMADNQTITIEFTAETIQNFATGDITRNLVEASGSRTVGTLYEVTQTFIATDFTFNSYGDPDMEIEKTSNAVDPLNPGDTYTYTVTVNNPVDSGIDLTGIGIYDPLPDGITYVPGSSQIQILGTVGDLFDNVAYNNNDGTMNWSTSWNEGQDDNSPSSGRVQISGGELRLSDSPDSGGRPSLTRRLDLSGATAASWTFDYNTTSGVDAADNIRIRVYNGSNWSMLENISGITGATSGTRTYDMTPYINAASRVQMIVRNDYNDADESFRIDNMYITATYEDAAAHNPPNFVTTDDGYTLEPGQYLRLTFDATVDDPLATGIEEIANTAYVTSNEFPLSLEASVTNTVVNPSAESAEVGDRVWFDLDGDGVFDVGEPGLTLIFGSGNTSTPDFPAMIPAP